MSALASVRPKDPPSPSAVRCPATGWGRALAAHTVHANGWTTGPGWRTTGTRRCPGSRWRRATPSDPGTGRATGEADRPDSRPIRRHSTCSFLIPRSSIHADRAWIVRETCVGPFVCHSVDLVVYSLKSRIHWSTSTTTAVVPIWQHSISSVTARHSFGGESG
jgi:hypothetical protein